MIQDIYLHFLDRQLQESLDVPMSENEVIYIIVLSLLMTENVYVSFSHICASSIMYPNVNRIINKLQEIGIVNYLLAANSGAEYIYKSQERYKNNKKRYPFYFEKEKIIKVPANFIPRRISSTEYIRDGLRNLVIDKNYCRNDVIVKIVKTYMPQDEWEALTIDAFDKCFNDSGVFGNTNQLFIRKNRDDMRRLLTCLHHQSLLQETGASIITNVLKCQYYDKINKNSPYDFQIYSVLLSPFISQKMSLKDLIGEIINFRNLPYWKNTVKRLYNIAVSIQKWCDSHCGKVNCYIYKKRFMGDINSICIKSASNIRRKFSDLPLYLETVKYYLNEKGIDYVMEENLETQKILLVVATKLELSCLLNTITKLNYSFIHVTKGNQVIYILNINNSQLYIIASQSGSIGAGGSILSINEAVRITDPDIIILGGIAFGIKKEDQKLGDILVSKQIWCYEPEKISGSNHKNRGDKITASPKLLNVFTSSSIDWRKNSIDFGLMASGEKLVDSKRFLNQLKKREPEIIGGEMEGAGLISVGQNTLKPWIMVKAICDWGYKKSSEFQMQAAQGVFEYILYTIEHYL